MNLDDVSTLNEAAAYLKVSPKALANLARAGKIGSLKQGRERTFPRAVIDAYVTANTVEATPPNPHGLTDAALSRVRKGGTR